MKSKNNIKVYISEAKIAERVSELGTEITNHYKNLVSAENPLVIVTILNGSFVFCADLIRKIKVPLVVEFMKASSYDEGTVSSGNVKIKLDLDKSIEKKHVLVVEDIVDTGLTILKLNKILHAKGPTSLKLASLLYKPARIEHPIIIDYLGFEIENKFVIGYGLDYDSKYREVPFIGELV